MGKWAEVACSCADRATCGHRDGLLLELWPGHIMSIGREIGTAGSRFEVFPHIGDPGNYDPDHELVELSPENAEKWMREIAAVRRTLDGAPVLEREHVERVIERFLEREEILERAGKASSDEPRLERALAEIREALDDAEKLCITSLGTGNPIRLTL